MFNFSKRGVYFDCEHKAVRKQDFLLFTPDKISLPLCLHKEDEMRLAVKPGSQVKKHAAVAVPVKAHGCPVTVPFDALFEGISKSRIPGVGNVPCADLRMNAGAENSESELFPDHNLSPEEIIEIARKYSIVDEIDGKFLHEKLAMVKEFGGAALLVDAADDQPYLETGGSLFAHYSTEIAKGANLAARAFGAFSTLIVLNSEHIPSRPLVPAGIQVIPFSGKYPAKPELGRIIMKHGGGLIIGVCAAIHLFRAVSRKKPQTTQFICVSDTRKTLIVEAVLGAPLSGLIEFTGLLEKLPPVVNGVMAGFPVPETAVVHPTIRSLTLLPPQKKKKIMSCIGCGMCNRTCPAGLMPSYIIKALEKSQFEEAKALGLSACTGCGCCTHVCPSCLPVAGNLSVAKRQLTIDN